MTTHQLGALCALLTLACGGCTQNELRPMDSAPVAGRGPITTRGGSLLELDPDGTLVQRAAPGDVQALLGVSLEERPEGLVVTERLHASTAFEAGDRLVAVLPDLPGARPVDARRVMMGEGRAVSRTADLAGFGLAPATLHVLVERAGQQVVVTQATGASTPVAYRLWSAEATRKLGFEGVAVGTLPAELRPTHARDDFDVLVTWVSVDSIYAHAGVRPLDVIGAAWVPRVGPHGSSPAPLDRTVPRTTSDLLHEGFTLVLHPDGSDHLADLDAVGESEELDLGVLAQADLDPRRSEVELALGFAYERVGLRGYDRRTDDYWRVGVSKLALGVVSVVTVEGQGVGELTYVNLTPLAASPDTDIDLSAEWNRPYFERDVVISQR